MGDVFFYHLTRQTLVQALPALLEKCLSAGWQVYIRGSDEGGLKWLDERLWDGDASSFLPHAMQGGGDENLQPILLGLGDMGVDRDCLIAIDGAAVTQGDVQQAKRVMVVFEGANEANLNTARTQWADLTAQGAKAKYWSQESGQWQLKAQKNTD